jgi:hypothetical protein
LLNEEIIEAHNKLEDLFEEYIQLQEEERW